MHIVIGVGGTDSNDDMYNRSSRGPAPNQSPWNDPQNWGRPDWNLTKPDISAPGVDIRSCVPGNTFDSKTGTSMACPHATGAVALCLQKNLDADYEQIYNIILDNADHPSQGVPYPNNNYGWGRLDCYAAVNAMPVADHQPDNQVKSWWYTSYIGDDNYNSSGAGQTVLQFADPDEWAEYHVKIQNDGEVTDVFRVKATETGSGTWTAEYYDALSGGSNITSQIKSSSGWITERLGPADYHEILVRVKPGSGMQGMMRRVASTSQSIGSHDKIDVVNMDTQCNILQPDNHVKNKNDATYIGDNIYNTTGENQTKNQNTAGGCKAIFHAKVENDGETWDVVYITGPGSESYWTIKYFDALIGGNNITDNVVNGTYFVIFNSPGDVAYLRVEVTPSWSCPLGEKKDVLITSTAGYNVHKKDAIKTVTKCLLTNPTPPDIRVAKQNDDAEIAWGPVTSDTLGNPITCDNYMTYRATTFDFVPGPENLFATGPDTAVVDTQALRGSGDCNYLSFSESEYDMKSTKSNMGYVFHKFVNENSENTDKNWVSLPWYSNYSTVSDLTDDLSPTGTPLTKITNLRDDQNYESWLWDDLFMEWIGADFAIVAGRGYEMVTWRDDTVLVVGSNNPDGLITLYHNEGNTSKNWVSIPYNAVYSTVSQITNEYSREAEAINKITNLRDDQMFESWLYDQEFVGWFGTNFGIEPGRGYEMVAVTDTTWNPTEYSNEAKDLLLAGSGHISMRANATLGSSTVPDRRPVWVVGNAGNVRILQAAVVKNNDYQYADSYKLNAVDSRSAVDQIKSSHSAMESENTYGDKGGPGVGPDERKISHTVRAYADFRGFENIVFTTYRVRIPDDVLTEGMIGSATWTNQQLGVIWFDAGNFRIPWKHGQEAVLIVEATKQDRPYYDVIDYVLDEKVDIQKLRDIRLAPMPEPGSSSLSFVALLRSIDDNDNIIGYSLHRDGKRLNSTVLQEVQSVADNTNLRLVIKGGHETVYSSDGMQSRPDQETPVAFAFSIAPNPFVKQIRMDYALPKQTSVAAAIYDVSGRQVRTVLSGKHAAGYYFMVWDGTDDIGRTLPSGIYFIKFEAGDYCARDKILMIK